MFVDSDDASERADAGAWSEGRIKERLEYNSSRMPLHIHLFLAFNSSVHHLLHTPRSSPQPQAQFFATITTTTKQ